MRMTFLAAAVAMAVLAPTVSDAQTRRHTPPSPPPSAELQPVSLPFGEFCTKYQRQGADSILVGIDRTTRQIRTVDRNGTAATFADLRQVMRPGDRVIIFIVYEHATSRMMIFDDCVPGNSSVWTGRQHPASVIEHDTATFMDNVAKAQQRVLEPFGTRQSARSAIVTTLHGMVAQVNGPIKNLLLMSDLLDTEVMNLRPTELVDTYRRQQVIMKSLRQSHLIPSLGGTKIRIHGYGLSDDHVNNVYPPITQDVMTSIKEVWKDFFRQTGADLEPESFVN